MLFSPKNLRVREGSIVITYKRIIAKICNATRLVLLPPKQVAIAVTQLFDSRIPLLLLVYDKP
jgi:hypothetical protein